MSHAIPNYKRYAPANEYAERGKEEANAKIKKKIILKLIVDIPKFQL